MNRTKALEQAEVALDKLSHLMADMTLCRVDDETPGHALPCGCQESFYRPPRTADLLAAMVSLDTVVRELAEDDVHVVTSIPAQNTPAQRQDPWD